MSKNQYRAEEKLAIIEEIGCGELGIMAAVYKYGISKTTLVKWRQRYEVYGFEGLEGRLGNRTYSAELKLQAVKDYLDGELSQYQIIDKYKIASRTQLSDWVKKYNSHSSLNAYNEGAKAMTKRRSTTWQERLEIVQYCLIHNQDYRKTAEQHQVSYQQVYQWMKKYQDGGQDALQDGRGRKKADEELTDTDRQKLAMKKLEAENERLRTEIAFLKKLEELERRRR
ncbi:transposase [Paenibacillus sp. TAF58]